MMDCSLFFLILRKNIKNNIIFSFMSIEFRRDCTISFEEFSNLQLIVMTFFLFSCLQFFFFRYTTKEQNFQNTSDDRPFLAYLQYIGISSVPCGQIRELNKIGRKTNTLFAIRSHIDVIIIVCLFPSGSYLARYLKKKLQPIILNILVFQSRQREKTGPK